MRLRMAPHPHQFQKIQCLGWSQMLQMVQGIKHGIKHGNRDENGMEWFKFRDPKVETALNQTSLALRASPAASHSHTLGRDQRNPRVACAQQKHLYHAIDIV